MPVKIDEIGKIYNNFLVLEKDIQKTKEKKRTYWICECQDCHTKKNISGTNLRLGKAICLTCKNDKQKKELIGKQFGDLTVIDFSYVAPDRHYVWKCKCKCGNIEDIASNSLNSGNKIKCINCTKEDRKKQYINEVGNIYGKLTVLKYDKEKSGKNAYWICKCECGNIISVLGSKLRYGQRSCGCEKSKGETKINNLLSQNNINYNTQISFEDCKYKDKLKFDFGVYNENNELLYLIEFDGIQHFNSNNNWNLTKNDFNEIKIRDEIKNQWCKKHNIPLIRIPYTHYDNLKLEDLLLKESKFIYE